MRKQNNFSFFFSSQYNSLCLKVIPMPPILYFFSVPYFTLLLTYMTTTSTCTLIVQLGTAVAGQSQRANESKNSFRAMACGMAAALTNIER